MFTIVTNRMIMREESGQLTLALAEDIQDHRLDFLI